MLKTVKLDEALLDRVGVRSAERFRACPIAWDPASHELHVVAGIPLSMNLEPELRQAVGARSLVVSVATAVGVAVNLAARLCSIAEPQEVLITAETLMRVGAGVVSEAGPPVLLKGLETPIVPYSVRRLDPPRTER